MLRLCLLCAFLLAGCTFGPSVQEYEPAREPAGIHGIIKIEDDRSFAGEVLAVRHDALILRAASLPNGRLEIMQISYEAIRQIDFDGSTSLDGSTSAWRPTERWRRKVRLRSRFPQGITPDIMDRLLRLHDQTRLTTIP